MATRALALVLLLLAAGGPKEALDSAVSAFRGELKERGVPENDLRTRHDVLPADQWRLPLVDEYLSKPLTVPADAFARFEPWLGDEGRLRAMLVRAGSALGWSSAGERVAVKPKPLDKQGAEVSRLPTEARRLLSRLIGHLDLAVAERTAALAKLTEEEWVHLRKYGSQLNTGMPVHTRAPLMRSHHARIDAERIYRAALRIAEVCDGLAALAKKLPRDGREFHVVHETGAGRIEIGGWGRNVYEKDCLLTIDFGGDDLYSNSAGGTLYTPMKVSVCIDLAGDDVYRTEVGLAQGSGMYGIGMLVDCAGDDLYESKNVSQGSGHVGVGVLWDQAGDDRYVARAVSQGTGFEGIGLLRDDGGRDVYRVGVHGQGYGGVRGFGILLDRAGNDSYRAGGLEPDEPREPDRFISMSQGCGYGIRSADSKLRASGGIGLLADVAGDDTYEADVFGQGCAYWYALGVLLDGAGRDRYEVHNYGQGAGFHMAVGVQMDLAGDDRFLGRAHALGHALDRSVGVFVDFAGDDLYESTDGESQGAAVKPYAVGLFADLAGDDTYRGGGNGYVRKPEEGREEEWPKAIFLDRAGRDRYPTEVEGAANGMGWVRSRLGFGRDED